MLLISWKSGRFSKKDINAKVCYGEYQYVSTPTLTMSKFDPAFLAIIRCRILSIMPGSSWAGWPVSRVRCWELWLMDCLEWVGVARHYNENRVPVLGYTLVLLKTMKSVVDMKKYYVLKSNVFVSHSIDSLGLEDFLWIYDLNLGIDVYLSTSRLLSTYCV